MELNTLITILSVAAILVVGIALALIFKSRQRTKHLKNDFGSEYDDTVEKAGGRKEAEKELEDRRKRVESLNIRSLDPDEEEEFIEKWRAIQMDFIINPGRNVGEADRLIASLMLALGFPMASFDRRVEDLSVTNPEIVSNYRDAHSSTLKINQHEVSTEELRSAMLDYKTVFDNLLGAQVEESLDELEPVSE